MAPYFCILVPKLITLGVEHESEANFQSWINQISFVNLFLTVDTLRVTTMVYSNEAMGAEVHYSAKVAGIISEAWR